MLDGKRIAILVEEDFEDSELIEPNDLMIEMDALPRENGPVSSNNGMIGAPSSLKEMEQQMIFKTLDETEGNRTHAAKILGISVRTLRNKLNEYKEKT